MTQTRRGPRITRLGHALFRFDMDDGTTLVTDPWIEGNPGCPMAYRDMSMWSDIDAVLLTHGHFDHITSVAAVAEASPHAQVIAPFELAMHFIGSGLDNVVPMNKGGSIQIGGAEVFMVGASHSSSTTDLETGISTYLGEPVGYVVRVQSGHTTYLAGDTGLSADMDFVIRGFFAADAAILPVDGLLTMTPAQAAYAARAIGVRTVVPCHDFPEPDDAPIAEEMSGFIEAFPFVGHMLGGTAALAELLEGDSEIEVLPLAVGESGQL